jgi:hypothetical protein
MKLEMGKKLMGILHWVSCITIIMCIYLRGSGRYCM